MSTEKHIVDSSPLTSDTLRQIFRSSAEGIIMVNKDGKILMANPSSERMFGYEEGELSSITLEKLLPERFRHFHVGYRQQYNENPRPRQMGAGRNLMAIRKDGKEFPVEISLSYHNAEGIFIVVAFIIDITERKQAEEALKRSEEQLIIYAAELEKKVKARTEALDNTILQLERTNNSLSEQIQVRKKAEEDTRKALERERELNELKSRFVSIASHEFRTPLSSVLSSASLIKKYSEKDDLEKIDKHVNRIKSSVSHLTNILNDFLSLGKLDEGRVDVQPQSMILSEFLSEVTEEMKPTFKKGQKVVMNVAGKERNIESDPKVLRNIFFNLLSNASKYSEPGKPVYLSISYTGDHIVIAVKDEGLGIPADDIKHIFERFFRAGNAGNIPGTGLGLNIVKRYLSLLNGNINFTSEYGKGSIFTVTLPY